MTDSGRPLIIALSDSTGETAQQTARAGLAQFGKFDDASVLLVSHVLNERDLEQCVSQAAALEAMLAYTLVGPVLRARVKELAHRHDVLAVDLLGPLIARLSTHLGEAPLFTPGLGHELDADYFRRIEAIEFAVANDDGRHPRNLGKADIVLVGVSRTSKTPLSNYIAHRGYRVANVPIVLGVAPPSELQDLDPRRVFAMSIDPSVLMKIRRERMNSLNMSPDADYGDVRHIRRESQWARNIFRSHPDWTVINVTRKAIEETASTILEAYRARFDATVAERPPRKGKKRAKRVKGSTDAAGRPRAAAAKRQAGRKKPAQKQKTSAKRKTQQTGATKPPKGGKADRKGRGKQA